MAFKCRGVDPY